MITFSKFGNYGNLGNQLHQWASLIGFSEKYNSSMYLPEWSYAVYFQSPPSQGSMPVDMVIEEPHYHYTPEFWDKYKHDFQTKNVNIIGWLQTEKYWQHCKEKVHRALEFEETFQRRVISNYTKIFQKETIAVSIRRGDFITNPNFYFLPLEYYFGALEKHFPEYNKYNILFFSDDLNYCVTHIKHNTNFYFPTGLSGIEQLCLMSNCQHYIISNSSFSWWGAMLGENESSKIIRSPYQLAGELLNSYDTSDYYPERWEIYDHKNQKTDIKNFLNSSVLREWYSLKLQGHKVIRKGQNYLTQKISAKTS